MAYQILNCDGTLLLSLANDIVDTTTTSLTLFGKLTPGYGQYVAENFIQLLENSASPNPPNAPQTGQLWFNTTSTILSMYATSTWLPIATDAYVNSILNNGLNGYATESYVNGQLTTALELYATESYVLAQIALSEVSPVFSGIPTAPTASFGNNTQQLATTAFVRTAQINGGTIDDSPIGQSTPLSGKFTTLAATQAITPSTTNGIIGTTLGDNANAGCIGEYVEQEVNEANSVALTPGINTIVNSFTLSPGDWNVWATIVTEVSTGCVVYQLNGGASSNGATPSRTSGGLFYLILSSAGAAPGVDNIGGCFPCGTQRFNISASTVINLVMSADFTGGTVTGYGGLFARRMR